MSFPKEKCKDSSDFPKEKWVEQCLFPKEELDSLIHWRPVSNIPVDEIYKDLPEVKEWHDSYIKTWLKDNCR
ncbi:MAG: hypothetical protein J6S85_02150 [Methanobrevibacter sp.]|nr:hypothetical protein [Methanobrevibacter sp.]MBO7712339.1 hypothetical protein [Methanobrevibacter sp.]